MALRPMTAAADVVPGGSQASLELNQPPRSNSYAPLQIVCNMPGAMAFGVL